MAKEDRHIFLYAKGHYQRNDIVKDMKKILGKRSGINGQHIHIGNVHYVLTALVWHYINHEFRFVDFIFNLNPNSRKNRTETIPNNFDIILIKECLFVLMKQERKHIPFELGEPDPTLLPINKP